MTSGSGKYIIYASGLAIVVTMLVQTAYTAVTGVAMSSTIPGLIASCLLFALIMVGVYAYLGRRMNVNADELISLYDNACDPQAFVEGASRSVDSMPMPYVEASAWYMGYYAQALLDLGRVQEAQRIEQNLYESVKATDSVELQAKIVVNLVPLVTKLLGPADALPVIQKGLELLALAPATQDKPMLEAYLQNQQSLAMAVVNGDDARLVSFYSATRNNPTVPMRVRVEQSWEEAKVHYRMGNVPAETECLEFIVAHGNRLALVKPAQNRLLALA